MENKNSKTLKESSLKGVALRPHGASRVPTGRLYRISVAICSVIVTVVIGYLIVWAGDLNPLSGPTEPTMKTLEDIYCAMSIDCTAASSTLDSPASPTSTMRTLEEVYNKAVNFPIPDTGQTTCYNNTEALASCGDSNFPRQDADFNASNSFTCDLGYSTTTYIVIDNCTGLEWQRYGHGSSDGYTVPAAVGDCYAGGEGVEYDGANYCRYYWQGVLRYCNALDMDGKTDWRLPNQKELTSILKLSGSAPYIEGSIGATGTFPFTKSGPYWSATTRADFAGNAYSVHFATGLVGSYDKDFTKLYVRCVRQ